MPRDEYECPERLALGTRVATAIRRVYQIRAQYDAVRALKKPPDSVHDLLASLQDARAEELTAEREYREHIEHHRCANGPPPGGQVDDVRRFKRGG